VIFTLVLVLGVVMMTPLLGAAAGRSVRGRWSLGPPSLADAVAGVRGDLTGRGA
jgi:hypothetical protein